MPDVPLCECHGEPMFWHRRPAGGNWTCFVKKRENSKASRARHRESENSRSREWYLRNSERHQTAMAAYRKTDKGRAAIRRYKLTDANRRRAAQIKRIEGELSSQNTHPSPRLIWPGTRSVAQSSTA